MDTEDRQIFADWLATTRRDCPSRTVVEVLANKWALYVLGALRRYDRPLRFNELRRHLEVTRAVYPTVPPRVEYGLTSLGVEAGRLTAAIADWSVAHVNEILDARDAYDVQATLDPQPLVTTPRRAS